MALKGMLSQESTGSLPAAKRRHPVYQDVNPLFGERDTLYGRTPILSKCAFITKKPVVNSFKVIGGHSAGNRVDSIAVIVLTAPRYGVRYLEC